MKTKKKQQFEVYNHRILWKSATKSRAMANSTQLPDSKHFALSAIVLTFFAFEGYLNWLGDLVCPDVWQKHEREFFSRLPYKGTMGKCLFLARIHNLGKIDFKTRPWKTASGLQAIRNTLAHSKPERGTRDVECDFPNVPFYVGNLQKQITPEFSTIAGEDIEKIANLFHKRSRELFPELIPNAKPFSGLLGFSSTEF